MKPTEFIVENSIIAQEADHMHRDHEVQMARSQMYSAAQAAIEIHRLLKDVSELEGLEGWVQSKLTLASQYLESVRDYMKYEAVSQEPEMMAFAESAAEYAVESLIAEEGMKDYVEKNPEKFNEPTRDLYARNTARFGGDDGLPGAKDERKNLGSTVDRFGKSATGFATGVSKPEGVPKTSKIPVTKFGMAGPRGEMDPRLGGDLDPKSMMKRSVKEREEVYPDKQELPPIEDRSKSAPRPTPVNREEMYPDNKKPPIEDRTKKLKERLSTLERKIREQSTPTVGGMSQTAGPAGRTTTSYNMGPVSASKSTGGGIPDVTSASTQVMDKTVTQHQGVGFGGAGAGVQQGGNKLTTVTEKTKKLKETASAGSSSAGSVAVSMSGATHKPTSGVPKRVGNTHKSKKIAVGKGIYDK